MTQSELPLYPKLSSIYNKIMQLAIAIVIIIVLMNIWQSINQSGKATLNQHFNKMAQQYLAQTAVGIKLLLKKGDKKQLREFVNTMATERFVNNIHLYDKTGQLIASSAKVSSINDLYGISLNKINKSLTSVPFTQEIRLENLKGYLRITLKKSEFTKELAETNNDHLQLFRLMMILAGLVGFLLTRGLNRFSRQGYRLNQQIAYEKNNS